MSVKYLNTPLTEEIVKDLKAGDEVYLSGIIYTARDAAHKKLCSLIEKGETLPADFNGAVIYFVGPTPAKPGEVIGSAGPTTSYRMDKYSPILIEQAGLKGMIGKGDRSSEVINSMEKNGAVYFAAIGGAGALIADTIVKAEVIAYEELGPEALRRLEVENFPVIVAIDSEGSNLYEKGPENFKVSCE